MTEKSRINGQNAAPQLKPTVSQALWGHLLQRNIPPALRGGPTLSTSTTPIAPADKAGSSTRILLHDTQATLEKFSGHVEKLTTGVDDARREVSTAHKVFQFGHEKLVEEHVALLNRCQTEIQKSLGTPAQASCLDQTRKTLATLEHTVGTLGSRFDALQMLTQNQLQALQAIQEQQMKLLSAIVPVLPLLQSIPLHIDTAKNDLKDIFREMPSTRTQQYQYARLLRCKNRELTPDTLPPSSESSPQRKRRKLDDLQYHSNREGGSSETLAGLSGSIVNISSSSSPLSNHLVPNISLQPSSSPTAYSNGSQTLSSAASGSSHLNLVELSRAHLSDPVKISTSKATVYPNPSDLEYSANSVAALEKRLGDGFCNTILSAAPERALFSCQSETLTLDSHLAHTSPPRPQTPPSTAAAMVDIPDLYPLAEPARNTARFRSAEATPHIEDTRPSIGSDDPANQEAETRSSYLSASEKSASTLIAMAIEHSDPINAGFGDSKIGTGRPMSLKDRRAHGLVSDSAICNKGKRYINFDDDDEWDE